MISKNNNENTNLKKSFVLPQIKRQTYFIQQGNNSELIKSVMQKRTKFIEQLTPFNVNFLWKPSNKYFNYFQLIQLKTKKMTINHLENNRRITNKFNLFQNLETICKDKQLNIDDYIPKTFILNLDSLLFQRELTRFIEYFLTLEGKCNNVWLLKPPDLNRGQGIKLFSDLENLAELLEVVSKKQNVAYRTCRVITIHLDNKKKIRFSIADSSGSCDRVIVLQKYLETPLLYNQRKFDIRVWVLIDHKQNAYIFKEAYFRLATDRYDLNNIKNLFIHLTNNAIQKHHPYYGKYEIGNQIGMQDMEKYLRFQKTSLKSIWAEIKQLIQLTFDCSQILDEWQKQYQFEIFGYDFMINRDGHVYLIEVNTNPCLEESSPLLKQLLPRMIDDAFKLTIDQIYEQSQYNYSYPVAGYQDVENLWELMQ